MSRSPFLTLSILFAVLVLLMIMPSPSSAVPAVQADVDGDTGGTPTPEGPVIDWANVQLEGDRDSYLPEGASPPPAIELVPDGQPTTPEEEMPDRPPPAEEPRPPEAPEPAPAGGTTIVVRRGDTLYDLAIHYGVSLETLVAANNLEDPSRIFAGQVLVVPGLNSPQVPVGASSATPPPPSDGGTYIVQAGDSPYLIARRHGVALQALIELNNITNPTHLKVGQRLLIPGSAATPAAAPEEVAAPATPIPAEPQPAVTEGSPYIVQRGDTLSEIAGRFGTTVSALAATNNILNPNRLFVGQTLIIPGWEAETASTPAPKVAPATPEPAPPTPPPAPGSSQFIWPVEGRNIAQYYRYGHRGIDVLLPIGTPIVASAAGVIEFSGWNTQGFGYLIIVDHGNGYRTLYAHQSELIAVEGQAVQQGELIGLSGHTGYSTHPHIHFEIIENYAPKNPCNFLPGGC